MATNPTPTMTAEQRKAQEAAVKAAVEQAITEGHIRVDTTQKDENGEVTERVSVLVKDKGLEEHYSKLVALDYEGALALAGGDDKRVWNLFTEAHDLKVRAKIRQQMLAKAEGPEKTYAAAAKALAKLPSYKGKTEAEIIAELQAADEQAGQDEDEGQVEATA